MGSARPVERGNTRAEVDSWIRVDGVDMSGTRARGHDGEKPEAVPTSRTRCAWCDRSAQRVRIGSCPVLISDHPQVIAQAVHGRSCKSSSNSRRRSGAPGRDRFAWPSSRLSTAAPATLLRHVGHSTLQRRAANPRRGSNRRSAAVTDRRAFRPIPPAIPGRAPLRGRRLPASVPDDGARKHVGVGRAR